jgi:hypothetical protein
MPGAVLQSVMPVGKTVDLKGLCSALTKSGKRCSRSGRDETVQRLSAMRDECWAELEQFRPAVEKALVVAEQHDSPERHAAFGASLDITNLWCAKSVRTQRNSAKLRATQPKQSVLQVRYAAIRNRTQANAAKRKTTRPDQMGLSAGADASASTRALVLAVANAPASHQGVAPRQIPPSRPA